MGFFGLWINGTYSLISILMLVTFSAVIKLQSTQFIPLWRRQTFSISNERREDSGSPEPLKNSLDQCSLWIKLLRNPKLFLALHPIWRHLTDIKETSLGVCRFFFQFVRTGMYGVCPLLWDKYSILVFLFLFKLIIFQLHPDSFSICFSKISSYHAPTHIF